MKMSGLSPRDLRARNSSLLVLLLGGLAFLRKIEQSYLMASLILSKRSLIPNSMLQIISSMRIFLGAREKFNSFSKMQKT